MASWTEEEFKEISFGDSRLDERFHKIAKALLEKPSGYESEVTDNWAEAKGCYRFFANEKVSKVEILKHHFKSTKERTRSVQDVVLAIQDTTYLDYTHCPTTEGLGKLTRPKKGHNPLMGLILHNTLAVTSKGECLGLLDQKIYKRSDEDIRKTNKTRPIEQKESFRWLESVRNISSSCFESKIVYVCDREGDIFEFFSEIAHQSKHHFLVRAASDRVIGDRCSKRGSSYKTICLWKFMNQQDFAGELQIQMPAQRNRQARKADCSICFAPVTFTPTYRRPGAKSNTTQPLCLHLYTIWIKEFSPTPSGDGLEWMLLTDLPVLSLKEAIEKIDWYKARWHIENYHKVLKSGFNVENSRLNHADKLEKFAALMSVIAARVYQIKLTGRNNPTAPCTEILNTEEWKVLYQFIHKTKDVPSQLPSAKDVMLWIAKLGGFLARKGDGHPGSIVIWRAWQRFMDILESWKTFQRAAASG